MASPATSQQSHPSSGSPGHHADAPADAANCHARKTPAAREVRRADGQRAAGASGSAPSRRRHRPTSAAVKAIELLRQRRVSLDVCPTSNHALGIVPAPGGHPVRALLDAGVACTLGADDPLLFGSGLLGEYEAARPRLGLTDEQLAAVARASVTTSDAPAQPIASATQRLDEWLTDPPADPHPGP